jgi:hypothetical protein
MFTRFVAVLTLALSLGVAAASAQPYPAPAPMPVDLPTVPPNTKLDPWTRTAIDYAVYQLRMGIWRNANTADGTVTYFHRYDMQVEIGRNSYRNIHLHQGTIINPRGATIQPGQHVQLGGSAQYDGSINADWITINGQ